MVASPQLENGHIDIANEIAEALMKVNLSPYESRVLWFLFRKTYGWHKKRDWITLSQFSKCIELDRRLIHRAIKGLLAKNMVVISRDDKNHISYGFQKNYERWKVSSKKMTVISRDDRVSSVEMIGVSSVEIHTKETITKETITKEKYLSDFEIFWNKYPKKQAKSKAKQTWLKIKPDNALLKKILQKIELFKQTDQWQKEGGQFIPMPSSWLNQERWEDEPEIIEDPIDKWINKE